MFKPLLCNLILKYSTISRQAVHSIRHIAPGEAASMWLSMPRANSLILPFRIARIYEISKDENTTTYNAHIQLFSFVTCLCDADNECIEDKLLVSSPTKQRLLGKRRGKIDIYEVVKGEWGHKSDIPGPACKCGACQSHSKQAVHTNTGNQLCTCTIKVVDKCVL